jgi:hypothetical protein
MLLLCKAKKEKQLNMRRPSCTERIKKKLQPRHSQSPDFPIPYADNLLRTYPIPYLTKPGETKLQLPQTFLTFNWSNDEKETEHKARKLKPTKMENGKTARTCFNP